MTVKFELDPWLLEEAELEYELRLRGRFNIGDEKARVRTLRKEFRREVEGVPRKLSTFYL